MFSNLIIFYGYITGESLGYNDDIEYWLEDQYNFYETNNIEFLEKEYRIFSCIIR
jgi:hypothetical protein